MRPRRRIWSSSSGSWKHTGHASGRAPPPARIRAGTTARVRAWPAKATDVSLTFLTPWGAIVALAAALPVAAAILGARRSERVRDCAPARRPRARALGAASPRARAAAPRARSDAAGDRPSRLAADPEGHFGVHRLRRVALDARSLVAVGPDAPCACPRSGDRPARSRPGAEVRRRDDDRPRRAAADADERSGGV